jgi:hypothetical protein
MILFTPNSVIRSADINTNFNLSTDILEQENPYKFKVYSNSAQTITSSYVKLNWEIEVFDTNNNFTSNQYTIPVNGYYFFETMRAVSKGGTAGRDAIVFYVDGVNYRWGEMVYATASNNFRLHGCMFDYFTAGKVISIYMYADGSNSTTLSSGATESAFSGFLVCT